MKEHSKEFYKMLAEFATVIAVWAVWGVVWVQLRPFIQ
jgi:hypothetical protein